MSATNITQWSYEENLHLTQAINAVLNTETPTFIKIRQLQKLKQTMTFPLSASHAEYYIRQQKQKLLHSLLCMIRNILLTFHFVFVLFRVYWYYYPEQNILAKYFGEAFSPSSGWDTFVYFYVIFVVWIVLYLIFKR